MLKGLIEEIIERRKKKYFATERKLTKYPKITKCSSKSYESNRLLLGP